MNAINTKPVLIVYTVQTLVSVKAQRRRAVRVHSENKTKKRKYDHNLVYTRGYSKKVCHTLGQLVGKTDWLSVLNSLLLSKKLIEEFKELVQDTLSFSDGYFEGRSKIWLVSLEDFLTMYEKYPKGEVTLRCDGRSDESYTRKYKREREEKEEEVDDIFKQLKDKHGHEYDSLLLCQWARTICSKIHDDLDNPPDIPAFRGTG